MINKIKLKFGSSTTKQALETDLTPITVFVGPNNSGKSKALFEIEEFCKRGKINSQNVILSELTFSPITYTEN
jgi:predicted ATPase